ncbi:MAG: tRNA 2-thiouridine(34) synthase MnmA [Clostridia bacterium]|nr:tRNA 2-thiouridine(34) synthase MnmA [Clostridia bacterium]
MKALLGMSGGVDSTYAVHELRRMGYEVCGAVIAMHGYTEVQEAELSAKALGVPLYTLDARKVFEEKVISSFIKEYRAGRTPNPCVVCNSEVKFKLLLDFAKENGFDKIATGHYADIVTLSDGAEIRYALKRSCDSKKDQTYMLWRLSQDILSHLIFPLSNTTKERVKEEALKMELRAAYRGESQEICFIPDGDYASYIEERTGKCPEGNFVDESGKILGKHKGIIHYTVGQRKGLGIALGERAFITSINPESNNITLSTKDSYSESFTVSDMVFSGISQPKEECELELEVKHRYLAPLTKARVTFLENGKAKVDFKEPIRAVTPGQSAVFYKNGIVMAGGIID